MTLAYQAHEIESVAWLGIREPFSSLSHLLGAIIFGILAVHLIRRSLGNWIRTASVVIFSACGMAQLLISGFYHMLWPGPARDFMLRADVATIFLLIAGSMTPAHAILFTGVLRWGALAAIWTVAVGAIIWRTLFCDLNPGPPGIAFFLLCGWSCSATANAIWRRYGWPFIRPAVLSGLAYTIGAIGLILHWPDLVPGVVGPHDLWHIAVLIGLILHWQFVNQFAAGQTPTPISPSSVTAEPLATEQVASFEQR